MELFVQCIIELQLNTSSSLSLTPQITAVLILIVIVVIKYVYSPLCLGSSFLRNRNLVRRLVTSVKDPVVPLEIPSKN